MVEKKPISKLEDHTGYWLRFVSNQVSYAFTRKIEECGVTVAEWVVLRHMFDIEAANPSQLADSLGMTRGAISKLIERLCRKKLVSRSSSKDDRRYQSVSLTATGRKLVPELARLADSNDHEFFGHLDAEQKSQLLTILQQIVSKHQWKEIPVN